VPQTLDLTIPTPAWAEPLLAPARYKGASGGRASGKSHFLADAAVEEMVCDPNLRFVCIREVQRSLRESVKFLVESKIRALGVEHLFSIQASEIRRKGGTGLMIFEGMQDHTADSIKSLEGFGRAWVEEAQNISDRSMMLLLPTIRAPGSEIWFSWNPDQMTDPVDVFFGGKPPGSIHVHSTYLDNPFVDPVVLDEARRLELADPALYEHVWLGGYFFGGQGRVYSNFSGKPYPAGNLDESIEDRGAELLVGLDFNVNPMTAIIGQKAADELEVIDSLQILTSNTEEMATELRARYAGRRVIICPDPSGNARKTSAVAGETDFTILRRHGFLLDAAHKAPLIPDRINAVQEMLRDTAGRRRLRIHPRAKAIILALTGQTYKEDTSLPDKGGGLDHPNDALGYLVWQRFNLLSSRRATIRVLPVR
jgi:hypothetical protein